MLAVITNPASAPTIQNSPIFIVVHNKRKDKNIHDCLLKIYDLESYTAKNGLGLDTS